MKKNKLFRLILLCTLSALVLSCAIEWTDPPTPAPVPTSTSTPTLTPTSTETPTPVPTDTPTPTATIAPTQSITSIGNALMSVAQGVGVAEAATYNPSKPGIHPIFLITAEEQTEWNKSLPEAWRPSNVSQTELVVVLRFNKVLLDWRAFTVRGYGKVYLGRFRTDTEVWLREAQTGTQIGYTVFTGQEPPPIPNRITSDTVLTGPPVASEILQLWLKSFVEK